jgi:integrase
MFLGSVPPPGRVFIPFGGTFMLTDAECRNAVCPPGKPRLRLTDSGGLYLEVSPAGSRRWFWKYRKNGKETRMALGSHPQVTLKAARLARDAAKLKKADGIDPVQLRKVEKLKASNPSGETFKQIALEWHAKQVSQWSPGHAERTKRQLERDLFPWLGARRLQDIEPVELLAVLRKIEARGAIETADRGLMLCRQIWRYGVATGRVARDFTADLKGALTPYRGGHFAAITDPTQLVHLLRASKVYRGGPIVRSALQLAPMLFCRPGELRAANWSEVDFENAIWTVPAARMKGNLDRKQFGAPHVIPLSRQAVEILRNLHVLTGHGIKVFPGERDHQRPISDNSVRSALISMGYTGDVHTWHGFRSTARTMLAERLGVDPLVIEAQLAHEPKDANGRAYNRTQYLKQRADMLQQWADFLDELTAVAEPTPAARAA